MWLRTCAWLATHTIQARAKLSFIDLPEISLTVMAQDWTMDILRTQPMGCFMWNHPVGTASPGWMGRWAKRDGMGQVFAATPNIGWIGMVLILQRYKWPKSAVPWVLHLGPYPFDFINCDFQIANKNDGDIEFWKAGSWCNPVSDWRLRGFQPMIPLPCSQFMKPTTPNLRRRLLSKPADPETYWELRFFHHVMIYDTLTYCF